MTTLIIACACITFVVQHLQLKAEKSRNATLEQRITGYQKAVANSNAEIASLNKELSDMSQVLIKRAEQNNQVKQRLQNDIEQLQQELEGIDCLNQSWPIVVSNKLRQDY